MPDWWKSTLHTRPLADIAEHLAVDPRPQLIEIIADLHGLDRRLEALETRLPEPGERFDWRAELRTLIACVRNDLLADATETLIVGATSTPVALFHDLLERQRLERHHEA